VNRAEPAEAAPAGGWPRGSVETWDLAARRDYTYSYLSFFGAKFGKKLMDGFWNRMAELGVDRNPFGPASPADLRLGDARARRRSTWSTARTSSTSACTSRLTS